MKYNGQVKMESGGNSSWVGNSKANKKYADMLFGPPSNPHNATYNFNEQHNLLSKKVEDKKAPFLNASTLNESLRSRNTVSRSAKQPLKRYKSSHQPSFVDETLFSSRTASPSLQHSTAMPPEMICKGLQVSSRPSSRMDSRPSSRIDSRPTSRMSSRPATPKVGHKASFVDDTLFGPKPVEPGWAAPWDKDKPKKPLLFGSSDVKVTINHNIQICRERPRKDLRSAGAGVRLQKNPGDKWGTKGTVVETHETPRSYIIDTDNGRYRRNRQHIRSSPQSPPTQPQDRDAPVDEPVDESAAVPEIHRQPSGRERKLPERFKDSVMY
ncbi:hypothetical protein CAPTEDRAFT_186933 [Capitella teleta]|uniref:RBPJ-interacting and tubulin-associated protein 1 n=1 Tax=Capitella teleta TaxID=283909 RepID=R7TLX8_CAPTE|nr:hypothetical protein CAPTEDRAFT_186933 [Capitella teleta]|eukprot:ELT92566.1 hypothetical protein CAPTEDRAFT_186933 [Capitella teleta]